MRYVFVCLVMLPAVRLREGGWNPPRKKDWPAVFISGALGISLYFAFEYLGVMRTTVANASLVLAAIPVFSILWGAIRGRHYRPACWLGVVVSMVGVFLIAYAGSRSGGALDRTALVGNLLLIGACLCWVAYIEISNNLLRNYTSLNMTAWQGMAGLVALLPMALWEAPRWQPVSLGGWAAALFLALICSALCFFWNAQTITALSPIQAAIFINLSPVVAVVAGVLLLGETVSLAQIIGGALIIGSIILVNIGMSGLRAR